MAKTTLLASLLALALVISPHLARGQPQGIIRIADGRFVDDTCTEFMISGWNGWNFLNYAVTNPSYVTSKFQQAQANGLNVLRIFLMGGGDEGSAPLLTAPGQLDEGTARGLDFILAEAAKYDVKLTLAFLNLWKADGVPQFEEWCGTSNTTVRPRPDLDLRPGTGLNATERLVTPYAWLMSPTCRQQVKDSLTAVVSHVSTITGVPVKDDPAIFSWNLLNEARCKYCGPEAVDSWTGDVAAHLKSVDPNHLVTTGEEGFFDETDAVSMSNPTDGNVWGGRTGQDFRSNHAHPAVDYAVMHLWPDNWRKPPFDIAWGQQWIDAHVQVASQLGKPLVLEEFGKASSPSQIASVRDPWFDLVNGEVQRSLQSGGPLRGSLFWQWDGESGPRVGNGSTIRQSDSTFGLIKQFALQLQAQPPTKVPGCVPRASPAASGAAAANGTAPASVPPAGNATAPAIPGGGVQLFEGPSSGGRKLLRRRG